MAISKNWAYLFLVVTTSLLGCETLSLEEKHSDYPVLLEKIPLAELQTRNDQYYENNNGLICSTLNEYGLTGFSRVLFPNDINPCLNRPQKKEELNYRNDLLEEAKNQLFRNSEYTGVIDIDELRTKEIISLDGCTICEGPDINNVPLQWKFTFEPQLINGIEVEQTEIVVYLDENGVNRIWGNWYNIEDPGFIEFGSNTAKNDVLGLKLRYSNERNQIFEQEVLTNQILEDPVLKYTAINTNQGLEIHKVWIVSVLQENSDEVRWRIRFSTVTGEMLDIELM